MRTIKSLTIISALALLLAGCGTTAPTTQARRYFHEAKTANAVLQFSSWEYTFLLQPRYDDNGFLLQVPREKVSQVLSRMNVEKRDLAVVLIGWNYSPAQLDQLIADWKSVLGGCGFQRLVVLKASGNKQIDGSLVIDDSKLYGGKTPSLTQL